MKNQILESGLLNLISPGEKMIQIHWGNLFVYTASSLNRTKSTASGIRNAKVQLIGEKISEADKLSSEKLVHHIQNLSNSLKSRFVIFREIFRPKPRVNNVPISVRLDSFPAASVSVVNQIVKVCCALHNSSLPADIGSRQFIGNSFEF